MEQYIDKAAVVAEIKARIETYNKGYANGDDCRADALETFLHDIDFLEVKEDVVSTDTIRKHKIEEAANEYVEDELDGAQKVISKVGFIFGAEWADENPRIHHGLSPQSVWHDSNKEQPQLGSDIVILQGKSGAVMNNTISVNPDRIWAYINDLLDLTKMEEAMTDALRMEYEKGRADVLRCIDPDEMVADFCSQPLSKTRSIASVYRQGILDILKRINNNEKTSITSTRSIDDGGVR